MRRLDIEKLRKNVTIYIALAMISFSLIIITATSFMQNSRVNEKQREYQEQINLSIKYVVNHYIRDYEHLINRLIKTENVSELIKLKDRNGLYKLFRKKWELWVAEEPNLEIMQFHLADGTSFLRMHKPEKFGDKISNERPMLKEIHVSHKTLVAYENGRYSNVYRIIAPIFDKAGEYIGALEFGINPIFILNSVYEINKFHGMMFIKDENLALYSHSNNMNIHGYSLQSQLSPELQKIYEQLHILGKIDNNMIISCDDKKYRTYTFVLKDYQNKDAVKIIFFQNITNFGSFRNYLLWVMLFSFGFILGILIWLIYRRIDRYQNDISAIYLEQIQKIEELGEQLNIAVNGTNDGLWDWNLQTGEIYFSPQWKKMLGYEDDELKNTLETWEKHVHPDDKTTAEHDFKANVAGETDVYENIHRLRHKDGSWVWILDRGQTKFDKDGKAVRMVGFHTDITKQKELEDKLRKSQKQFESFMENIPAYVTMKDKDNCIIYANSLATGFFHKENIVGLDAFDLLGEKYAKELYKLNEITKKDGFAEVVFDFENNGKTNIFRVMSFCIGENGETHIGSIYFDITKEFKDQHEVTKLKSALDRSPVSIMMTDINGDIEYVNPNYTKVTGYTLEELLGKNPRIVKSGYTSDEIYAKMWKEISSGNIWNSDVKNIAKDGSTFWEDSTIIPSFGSDGKVDGYIAFKLEITEKKYLEKELLDKEEIMIAQSRHAAMGEMISMIAHQWRQPISVIAMDANNILADIELEMLDEKTLQSGAEDIIAQTQELSKTIDDFRNFFRPEKTEEELFIKDIVDEAMKVIGKSLENNNIDVVLQLQDSKKIKTYSRELMQVLINLIKNAKEILIERKKENKKIFITLKEKGEHFIFNICDNGGGVDDEIIDKIFDPYFTTKGEKNGTGLGLYMSRTIVEKHLFGSLSVSNKDGGACFKITLPLTISGRGDLR